MIKYSESKNTCYDTSLNYSEIPEDAIEVSQQNWQDFWCALPPERKQCAWDAVNDCFYWEDVPAPSLEECKQQKLADITTQYNQQIYAGFVSDDVSYDSTPENQNRIMMAKISGGGMVLSNSTMVNLTATQADQVFSDMSTYINGFNERYAKSQTEISEATTNDQVNAVVLL